MLILIPNVNASLHRFFCPCAMSLLGTEMSAASGGVSESEVQ